MPTLIVLLGLAGCKGNPSCTPALTLSISPATAVADHAASSPGNQYQFSASLRNGAAAGCAVPASVQTVRPHWTVSDPLHVQISNAQDDTNGLATCSSATRTGSSVLAAFGSGTATQIASALLICR